MLKLIGFTTICYLGWSSGVIPWMFLQTAWLLTDLASK